MSVRKTSDGVAIEEQIFILAAEIPPPPGATTFNALYYLARNPDVAAAGADPLQHYLAIGWIEGRDPNVNFSTTQYLAHNPDVAAARYNPLQHFELFGRSEGRAAYPAPPVIGPADPLVDQSLYFAAHPDVAASGVDASTAYHLTGWKSGYSPSTAFDAAFYLARNPDVAAAHIDPLAHFEAVGWREGRDPSAAFSVSQYLAFNPDVAQAGIDPLIHYVLNGRAEGRLPRYDIDFDAAYYRAANPDVASAGYDPFLHYIRFGAGEGRNPNAFFDTRFYLASHPDAAASGMNPLVHFETIGWHLGYATSPLFDAGQYLAANPDVRASGIDPLRHFLSTGLAAGLQPRTDLDFDQAYYLRQNPDVAAAHVNPLVHFLTVGWTEGRNPNAFFNVRFYLTHNPDVAAAGIDPLVHYIRSGQFEGRDPSALFSTRGYLAANPDVAAAHYDPLAHYLRFGQFEGRSTGVTPGTAPTADLAEAFRLGAAGAHLTAAPLVELVGHADTGAVVRLSGTTLMAVADPTGTFVIPGVALAPGHNTLVLTATDTQGRIGTSTLGFDRTADSGGTVVADWDQLLLNAIVAVGTDPEISSRAMALEGIVVLDVINALQGKHGFLVSLAAPPGIASIPAIASAAHAILSYLFPTQTGVFDAALSRTLAGLPAGTATDAAIAFGRNVAAAVIAIRDPDGWNRIVIENGSTVAGKWRPTAPDFGLAQEPQWGQVTPFVLTSDSQFRAPAPPAIGSAEDLAGVAQLHSLGSLTSTTRTADQTQIAKFWADGAGTITPPGHWNQIARQVVLAMGLDSATQARVLAEVSIAMADSAFAAWDTKFEYDTERPITAIRTGDTGATADPAWSPLIKTPPHPSYVSGHSTFSASAAAVLDAILGTAVSFSTTSPLLPGVTRSFTSFDSAAAEAAISRIYGGIHFSWDSAAGLVMGGQVGAAVIGAFDGTRDTGPMLLLEQRGATSGPLVLTGFALDDTAPLTTITATLDGGAPMTVAVDGAGRFTLSADTLFGTVASGVHQVVLKAADSAGHVATTSVPYTRGVGGISLSVTAPSNNGFLLAGDHLTGTVASTAATLTSVTYQFDNGTTTPVLFTSAGTFDMPLDLSTLAAGLHTLIVRATDAAGGMSSVSSSETLQALVPLTVTSLTPANGTGDVGVTYRPEVTFSRAVDPATLTASSFYATTPSGAKVAATIVPRADGTGASLFFLDALPGSATITLHVVGSLIKAAGDGRTLDAAGTGIDGTTRTSTLVTVSTASLETTILTGIIADPGPDLQPGGADDVRNNPDGTKTYTKPIVHAKVYVLGHEDQAVYTDAAGRFTLTGVPTGTVKVAVDGRTATNAPTGIFFPEMVMDTQVTAGVVNTLPGGMGSLEEQAAHKTTLGVYLPRVQESILQTLSTTVSTVVTVPVEAGGLLSEAQRSLLSLTVAPGSLVGQDGQPIDGARVGISPVPADLVKDMLPQGLLQHTFDITIQAPGGAAFTTGATLTLPNVFGLAPGAKTYLLSFDHTTGRLVIDGTATASADGLTVTTDPGSGVTKPGWHGMTPQGSSSSGPGSPDAPEAKQPDQPDCFGKIFDATKLNLLKNAIDCAKEVAGPLKAILDLAKNATDLADNMGQLATNLEALKAANAAGDSKAAQLAKVAVLNNSCASIAATFSALKESFRVESSELRIAATCIAAFLDSANAICGAAAGAGCISLATSALLCGTLNGLNTTMKLLIDTLNFVEGKFVNFGVTVVCDAVAHVANQIGLLQVPSGAFLFAASPGQASPATSTPELDAAFAEATAAFASAIPGGKDLAAGLAALGASKGPDPEVFATTVAALERATMGKPANIYYEIRIGTEIYRGLTDGAGKIDFFFPAKTAFTINYYDPKNDVYATYAGTSAESGATTVIPNPLFFAIAALPTTGPGGLPDLIEEIVGGSLTRADSLVPGVQDVVAVHQGVAATRSLLNTTGVIASAPLQGTARQVVVTGSLSDSASQFAYVATGEYGLAIVNVTAPLKPELISETKLSGNALDVAVDAGLGVAAVADGTGGLVVLNVANLAAPVVIATIAGDFRAVQVFEGIAYATDVNSVVAVDLSTGTVLQRLALPGVGTLVGLTRDGSTLWAIDASGKLTGVALATGSMVRAGQVATGSTATASVHLYAAAGVVYVPNFNGGASNSYQTFDVRVPATPVLLGDTNRQSGGFGDAVALNGSGQGVGIGGGGGANALNVLDTSNPANTGVALTQFALPAKAYGVAIGGGVAYVADGTAGLQVVNYKAIDTSGVGPTITIVAGPGGAAPGSTNVTLTEGSLAGFTVTLADPGQIRNVELLVNGAPVVNDGSYPFELSSALPSIAGSGSSTASLAVRATDTAGHVSTTAPVTVTLTPDRTTPVLLDQTLVAGSTHSGGYRSFSYRFSKPIDAASLDAANFTLTGPGGVTVAPASIQARAGGLLVVVTYPLLGSGAYTAGLVAAGIRDRAGNLLGTATTVTPFAIAAGGFTTEWTSAVSGKWSTPFAWEAGHVPGPDDRVLLPLGTGVVVTHDTGTDTVAGIALAGGTLALTGGTLDVEGTLDVQAGVFSLTGGTLMNAVVKQSGGALKFGYVTLDGTSFANGLDLRGGNVSAVNGLTIGSGTIDLRGSSSSPNGYLQFFTAGLAINGDQVFASQTILMGWEAGAIDGGAGTYSALTVTGTLTLGAAASIAVTKGLDTSTVNAAAVNNAGTITVSGDGHPLRIANLANTGTVSVTNNGRLVLTGTSFTNTGTVAVTGATLELAGASTLATLGTVTGSAGPLILSGTLDLGGGTLNAAALPAFTTVQSTGTIRNGTAQASILDLRGGTLDGVTLLGSLAIHGGSVSILNPAAYTGATLDLRASDTIGSTSLTFRSSMTLDNVAISMGGQTATSPNGSSALGIGSGTLTLGAGATLSAIGGYSSIFGNLSNAGTITSTGSFSVSGNTLVSNSGAISFAASTIGYYTTSGSISASSVVNTGTITGAGPQLAVQLQNLTNSGTVRLTDGARLDLAGASFTNTGTVDVGSGGVTLSGTATLAQLATIAGSGGTFNLAGRLDLAGGTLTAASLAAFTGIGVNNYATIKNGTIEQDAYLRLTAQYGLVLDNTSWTRGLKINAGSFTVQNGLSVTGGAFDVRGGFGGAVTFAGATTLSNMSILLGTSAGSGLSSDLSASYSASQALVLDTTTTVGVANGRARLNGYVVNNGTISVAGDGRLAYTSGYLSGTGAIDVAAGAVVEVTGLTTFAALTGLTGFTGSGGVLAIAGYNTLDLGGAALNAATLLPAFSDLELTSAVFRNGTVTSGAATSIGNATLRDMTLNGTFRLTGALTVQTALATTGLVLNTGGQLYSNTSVNFTAGQNLDNTVVNVAGGPSGTYAGASLSANTGTLTIGASSSVNVAAYATLSTAGTIVNAGTITSLGLIALGGTSFANQGTLAETGGTITVSSSTTFINSGSITLGAGAKLDVQSNIFANTGTITVAAGGELQVDRATTLAKLGALGGGGKLTLYNTLDLGGGTLDLDAAGGIGTVSANGYTVSNGTIHEGHGVLRLGSGTRLDHVAITTKAGATVSTADLIAKGAAQFDDSGLLSFGPNGDTVLFAGPGALIEPLGKSIVFGAGDHDTYKLTSRDLGFYYRQSTDIYGFAQGNGDVLDLTGFLANTAWDHTAGTLGTYLSVASSGTDTVISGSDTSYNGFGTIATLHNATTSLASLQAAGAIKLS